MPDATALDQATAMIEKTWGRPIEALESFAVRSPSEDPLLRSVMHIRSSLVVTDNAVAVHQDRLHALSRPGRVAGRVCTARWSGPPVATVIGFRPMQYGASVLAELVPSASSPKGRGRFCPTSTCTSWTRLSRLF